MVIYCFSVQVRISVLELEEIRETKKYACWKRDTVGSS